VDTAVLVDEEYVAYLVGLTKSADPMVCEQARAELLKVGPKGYEHGWIFVGAPGVGSLVHHPTHGHGRVVRAGKKTSEVHFSSGHKAAFEHSATGPERMSFVSRVAHNASKKRPLSESEHRLAADAQVQTDRMGPAAVVKPPAPVAPTPAAAVPARGSQEAKDQSRASSFAGKWIADVVREGRTDEPTDENLDAVFANTANPPPRSLYDQIRSEIERQKADLPAAAPSGGDRKIADAEARVKVTRERLDRAEAAFQAASRDPKAEALGEHFPLGTGGSGGGRRGSTDAQLSRYVEARKARDAAQSQHIRAEAQLKELTARRDAAGKYSKHTVSAGDAIKVDGTWWRVQKANEKTVQIDAGRGMDVKYPWARVTDHRPATPKAEAPAVAVAVPESIVKPPEPPKEESWQVSRRLHEATSKDQARAMLQGRSMTELRDINDSYRRQHNYRSFGPRKTKKADLIEQLVNQSVGYKERTGQLRKPGSVFGRTGTEMPRVSQTDLPASLGEPARPNDAHEFTMPATRSSRPVQAGDRVKHGGFSTGHVVRLERNHGIDGAVVSTEGERKYPNWVPLNQIHVKPTDEDAKVLAGEAAKVKEMQAQAAAERVRAEAAAAEQATRAAAARQALAASRPVVTGARAKHGDLAIRETTSTTYHQGGGRQEGKQFELVRVASASKDGEVKTYHPLRYGDLGDHPTSSPVKVPAGFNRDKFHVLPTGTIDEGPAIAAARANRWHPDRPQASDNEGKPFGSLEEIKAVLQPHVKDAPPVKVKPLPSLIPKPARRGTHGLAPKAPAEVNYVEPTGLDPGAKVAWTHHHEDGTTSQRTGRVWDAAPGTNRAWVVPDERKPSDPYSAIVVEPERRGSTKLVSHDSTNHTTGSLAHAAAEQAHVHRYGPKPMPFTPANVAQHITEAADGLGVPSGLTNQYGTTQAADSTLQQILQGFHRNTSVANRLSPTEAVQRLREAAELRQRNIADADASDLGRYDNRYKTWQDMAKLYTEVANRIEADWEERVRRAQAQGSANKAALTADEYSMILRAAEYVWKARTVLLAA